MFHHVAQLAAQPILPNLHPPKQYRADSGRTKIKVNPTQFQDHQVHPVVLYLSSRLLPILTRGVYPPPLGIRDEEELQENLIREGRKSKLSKPDIKIPICVQSCAKKGLLSFENHSQNVPLPTPKFHYAAIFQPSIPGNWSECFYTTLYRVIHVP